MWLYCGYYGSLNNALQANADFNKQIFARDCNNSGETEKVINLVVYIDRGVAGRNHLRIRRLHCSMLWESSQALPITCFA